ncbi:hypothetical protein AGOR_G00041400 [Albula goreensis]|uniref:Ig-like domain-containing protein n=1 Tax=Albula goreensis TaxID=1534307 RepID=A0A8T3E1J4_9TELE|nr:hypothetical protein AGOR_G00041400 [Albula goreensis]
MVPSELMFKMRISLFSLYLLCCGSANAYITALCGDSVILRCPVKAELNHIQYRAVSWYQVSEDHLTGIFRWDRRTGSIRKFVGLTRPVECPSGDGFTLELQNVTAKDGGIYRCALSAPVGQVNKEGDVKLNVMGCSQEMDLYMMKSEYILLLAAAAVVLLGVTGSVVLFSMRKIIQQRK